MKLQIKKEYKKRKEILNKHKNKQSKQDYKQMLTIQNLT